jgi:aryl-alcohol dehydrogenase-like predicted oxidoreductase
VSEVSVEQLKAAREIVDVVSVQNLYNLTNRQSQDVLDYATAEGIAFIPWFPIATGDLAGPTARSPTSRASWTPRRPRWRWPGCCRSRR